jgi:hypothetical protein
MLTPLAPTGISAVASDEAQRLCKWLRDVGKAGAGGGGGHLQLLRPNWQDLIVVAAAGGRMGAGQWWEQGARFTCFASS